MNTLKFRTLSVALSISILLLLGCDMGGVNIEATATPTSQPVPKVVDQPVSVLVTEASGLPVQAQATERIPIRTLPGPTCPIIGWVELGDIIDLTQRNMGDPDYWYETDFLGPDNLGWVYYEPLELLNDDTPLPRVPRWGCADVTEAPPPPDVCAAGWLPESGCTCCGSTLVCADGTVAQFNPACMPGGDEPDPEVTCECIGSDWVCSDGTVSYQDDYCVPH